MIDLAYMEAVKLIENRIENIKRNLPHTKDDQRRESKRQEMLTLKRFRTDLITYRAMLLQRTTEV